MPKKGDLSLQWVVFLFLAISVLAEEKLTNSILKCQFGKSTRKQIEVWPLSGTCMRDMVVHLAKSVRTITNDELGIITFQEQLDKLDFVNSLRTPKIKLDQLSDRLSDKIKSYSDLLRDSNDIIQPILSKQEENIYLSQKQDVGSGRPPDICSKIVDALAMNFRSQNWKNLHVLPVNQPMTVCGPPLIHNIGPLLLAQCSRTKKVVLLLEHGAFMSEADVALAQMTAKTVVHMLTDTDLVSVVGMAINGSINCHNQSLSRATDIHKIRLDRHIESLTRFTANETFRWNVMSFLKKLRGEIILLHLTNSLNDLPQMQAVAASVKNENLTVHLGTVLIVSNQQTRYNQEMLQNGSVIVLPTPNDLGYEIAKLFTGIKCNKEDVKPYYLSTPYYEPYSKVMMLSIGHITNTALLSYNVKLRDFVEDITYFNAGEHVQAVLLDRQGVVWMHKNFPRMETIVEQPLKVYFGDIESLNETEILRSGLMKQTEGSAEVTTTFNAKKQLMWKHLAYNDLIVCLVIEKLEEALPIVKNPPLLPSNILHHRLDLILQSSFGRDTLCSYSNNRIGSLEAGVVYFSPWCFQSPSDQAKQLEHAPAVTIQSYMAYIKDVTRLLANPGLQPSVKPDVAVLARMLNHFKTRHAESAMSKYIVQRYVTSVISGVLQVYPGIVLDSELDPKRRAWYAQALENPGKIVFTPPYLDASGVGYVVTLSHTAYEGRPAALHSNKDPVVAVLSMDLTVGYLAKMLSEMFPLCDETHVKCFVMDDEGYLVYHPRFSEPGTKVDGQHLMNEEFLVANDILNHEYFVKKTACASHMDGTIQRYYQFNISLDEVLTNVVHGEHSVMYQLASVPGTNIFLGVVNVTSNSSAFCPCSTINRLCLNCVRMEQTDCECPCECSMFSQDCNQKVHDQPEDTEQIEVCPAPSEQGSSQPAPWVRQGILSSCQSYNCRSYHTKADCLGLVGCQWCELDADGKTPLSEGHCSDLSLCFGGVLGTSIPYGDGTYNLQLSDDMMNQEWPSVGPVAGGILAIVIILGVSLFCYKLRNVQGLEHQCLHNMHNSPDTLRMTNLDGDIEPIDFEREPKANLDSALLRDVLAPISPYRVFTNYRRPPGADSDHGYSTMTPHEDSEQQTFVEPLLILGGEVPENPASQSTANNKKHPKEITEPQPSTNIGGTLQNRVLVPVTVHRNMDTHYC